MNLVEPTTQGDKTMGVFCHTQKIKVEELYLEAEISKNESKQGVDIL